MMKKYIRTYAKVSTKVSLLLLLSVSLNANIKNNNNNLTLNNREDKQLFKEALIKRVLRQVDTIDKTLEEIAQAVNNKVIKVKNKSETLKFVKDLRSCLNDIKKEAIEHPSSQCLNNIIEINRDIIADLYEAFNNNLENLKSIKYKLESIPKKSVPNLTLLEIKYNFNQNLLDKLRTIKFDQVVQYNNRFDNFLSKTEKFVKDWKLKKILYRSLPYAALAAYITVHQEDERLSKSLLKFKRLMLSPFKYSSVRENQNQELKEKNKSIEVIKEYKKTKLGKELDNLKNMGILGIDLKPYFNLSLVGYFMKHIVDDYKSIKNVTDKQFAKLINKLRSQPKESLPTFDKIIGYNNAKQELNNLVYYFKNISLAKKTGILFNINNNYIIEGNLDISETLAKATLGEINKDNSNNSVQCSLVEIHATELVTKKLQELIDDSLKPEPLVILIKELDLIDNQINKEALIKIIKDIDKLSKNNKVAIIATTNNKELIAPALIQTNRFSKTIKLDLPNLQERASFIEQELSNYCVSFSNFDINKLAEKTNNYSYADITQWIKKAQIKAYTENSVLSLKYFI